MGKQVSKVFSASANELPWFIGFQIGVTLDVLLTFLKSGDFGGHL